MMMIRFASLLLIIASAATGVKIGDECGVNGEDFLNDAFTGEYFVSGEPGCSIEGETECYCAPNYGSPDPVGPWVWACNSVNATEVPFGPGPGKTCPDEIPVPIGYESDVNPVCDETNPTGQAGDPPCAYSDCDTGGNFSAVCGCVDLTFGQGGDEQWDLQWHCLHATCSCPGDTPASSGSAVLGGLPFLLVTSMALVYLN